MPEQNVRSGWDILINWVILSLAGFFIGLSSRRLVFGLIFGMIGGQTMGKIVEGAVIGAVIGVAQLMALPPRIPRNPWWIVASTLGWGLGWGFGWRVALTLSGGFSFVFALVGGLSGLGSSLIQWWLLRSHVPWAGLWIPGSVIGWAGGLAVGMGIGGSLGWPLGGGVAGLMMGAVLVWLVRSKEGNTLTG